MRVFKKWMLAAILICGASVFTACTSENNDNPVPGVDSKIVGNWFSDVSGIAMAS